MIHIVLFQLVLRKKRAAKTASVMVLTSDYFDSRRREEYSEELKLV